MMQGHYAFQCVLLGYFGVNNVVWRVRVSFSFAKPLEVIGNDGQTLSLPKIANFQCSFGPNKMLTQKNLAKLETGSLAIL